MDRDLYIELSNAAAAGIQDFPNGRFFHPHERFLEWLRDEHSYHRLYDVGAGDGYVVQQIRRHAPNITIVGIDLFRRTHMAGPVELGNGADYPYVVGSIVMLCRPCHGEFVQYTIEQACERGAFKVLYVGKEENLEDDTRDYFPKFKLSLIGAGRDRECVWTYSVRHAHDVPERREVFLVDQGRDGLRWFAKNDGGDRWVDVFTLQGWQPIHPDDKVLDRAVLEDGDTSALDWERVVPREGTYGWLDRKGRLWACGYMEHNYLASLVFDAKRDELINQGFVKVSAAGKKGEYSFYSLDRELLTEEQKAWLVEHGHDLDPTGTAESLDDTRSQDYVKEGEAKTGRKLKKRKKEGD